MDTRKAGGGRLRPMSSHSKASGCSAGRSSSRLAPTSTSSTASYSAFAHLPIMMGSTVRQLNTWKPNGSGRDTYVYEFASCYGHQPWSLEELWPNPSSDGGAADNLPTTSTTTSSSDLPSSSQPNGLPTTKTMSGALPWRGILPTLKSSSRKARRQLPMVPETERQFVGSWSHFGRPAVLPTELTVSIAARARKSGLPVNTALTPATVLASTVNHKRPPPLASMAQSFTNS